MVGSECAEFSHSVHTFPINPSRIIHVCSMMDLIYCAKMLQSFKNWPSKYIIKLFRSFEQTFVLAPLVCFLHSFLI